MGLCLIEVALRRRHRGFYFRTVWGWLFSGLAVIVLFFGVNERRRHDDDETAERKALVSNISRIIAAVLFVLAIILDTTTRN